MHMTKAEILYWQALQFAANAHKDHVYGEPENKLPFFYHIQHADKLAVAHGVNDFEMRVAILLHDTIEDSPEVTREVVEKQFGKGIADMVWAVTDPVGPDGKPLPRRERSEHTYPKIKSTPGALTVKLADRLSNVVNCFLLAKDGSLDSKIKMYRKEYGKFRETFYDLDHPCANWTEAWKSLDAMLLYNEFPERLRGL